MPAAIDDAKLQQYIDNAKRLDEIEAEADKLGKEQEKLEALLLQQFIDTTTQSTNRSGRTAYVHSQLWASAERRADGSAMTEEACEALIAAGYASLVSPHFNTNTLSGVIRELPVDEATMMPILPEALQGKIKVTRKFSLRLRKSSGSGTRAPRAASPA